MTLNELQQLISERLAENPELGNLQVIQELYPNGIKPLETLLEKVHYKDNSVYSHSEKNIWLQAELAKLNNGFAEAVFL